ncbi:hypothetical protein AURDEDRAFT_179598 [Auricularia subglabra TFB-10046 SS5]|nr:hypothetical protein AURDEDRAFT_179598 [Auricularia subglabra TFB-10046 SS5]
MAKGNLNPAEAHRKAQQKKELKKNKATRKTNRDAAIAKKDTFELEDSIRRLTELEDSGKISADDVQKLKDQRFELARVKKIKEAYLKDHPDEAHKVYRQAPRLKQDAQEAPRGVDGRRLKTRRIFDEKTGLPRHPERSLYYDPVMNPYGVPPPGMPYAERPLLPGEVDSEAEDESSEDEQDEDEDDDIPMPPDHDPELDDIPMPEGPPPGQEAEDEDFIPPLPEGPPPLPNEQPPLPPGGPSLLVGAPPLPLGAPPLPVGYIPPPPPGFAGGYLPPPPPGGPPGFAGGYVPPPPPGFPGAVGFIPPPPPGGPPIATGFIPPPPPGGPPIAAGYIPPPPPGGPPLAAGFMPPPPPGGPPMVAGWVPPPPLGGPPIPGFAAAPSFYPLAPALPHGAPPLPGAPPRAHRPFVPPPTAGLPRRPDAPPAVISAEPQLRDLRKEATAFVPAALRHKRKTPASGATGVDAAAGAEKLEEVEPPADLGEALRKKVKRV